MEPVILSALRDAVGSESRVSVAPEDLATYAYDGTWAETRPEAVVHPESSEQVAAILRVAHERRVPVVPRGAGTGLAGGSLPVPGSICLNLARMNRILEISEGDGVAVVQPGVVTRDLQEAVEQSGLFYPPDPASLYQCTIGGNVSTNAGGPRCLKYGVTGDYVLAMEVCLADGTRMRLGGRTIKNVTGYNLAQLFVGAEGTLGVVTEVTLRLVPKPETQRAARAAFPRLADACAAVGSLLTAGIVPMVAELMDQATIRAVEKFKSFGLPTDVEALLLVAVDGAATAVAEEIEKVTRTLRDAGASEVHTAHTEEENESLWEARRAVSPAVARLASAKLGEDITVPRSRVPEMVARLQAIGRDNDLPLVVYGHIGDGNLHPTLLCDRRQAAVMKRVARAAGQVLEAAVDLGGSLSGEHGIGIFKRDYMSLACAPQALRRMAEVKALFDPLGIMNPGKKLPNKI